MRSAPYAGVVGAAMVDIRRFMALLRHVPKYADERLDRKFRALADPTRRAFIQRLVQGPASVSELARPFDMALPTVVQHLRVLENAGIATSDKVGRVRTYQLGVDALSDCGAWIGQQRLPVERQLDRLGTHLQHPQPSKEI